MTLDLAALCFDANDPTRLARFWAGLLGGEPTAEPDGAAGFLPGEDPGFRLRFVPSTAAKTGPNQIHLDLTSTSGEGQQQTVARALALGARHLDVGQRPEEGHVVLADPEGNELCVLEPGNRFLEGCGFLGALSCDGTHALGSFWSRALGWPLVWDQDEETAIQSPGGGPKITWGGPPLNPKQGKVRLHLEVAAPAGAEHTAEVERLIGLGATPGDLGEGQVDRTVLVDPDGNEFCVLAGLTSRQER